LVAIHRITTSKTTHAARRNTNFESGFANRYFAIRVPGAFSSRLTCHCTGSPPLDGERDPNLMNTVACAPHRHTSVVSFSADILSGAFATRERDAVLDTNA
jgi:hypothetical protein